MQPDFFQVQNYTPLHSAQNNRDIYEGIETGTGDEESPYICWAYIVSPSCFQGNLAKTCAPLDDNRRCLG